MFLLKEGREAGEKMILQKVIITVFCSCLRLKIKLAAIMRTALTRNVSEFHSQIMVFFLMPLDDLDLLHSHSFRRICKWPRRKGRNDCNRTNNNFSEEEMYTTLVFQTQRGYIQRACYLHSQRKAWESHHQLVCEFLFWSIDLIIMIRCHKQRFLSLWTPHVHVVVTIHPSSSTYPIQGHNWGLSQARACIHPEQVDNLSQG